jgi:hypothetical protein
LVNLVEDWEVLEEYAGDKQGYYQILANDGTVEARVAIGRLGFKKDFDNNADRARGGGSNPILGFNFRLSAPGFWIRVKNCR